MRTIQRSLVGLIILLSLVMVAMIAEAIHEANLVEGRQQAEYLLRDYGFSQSQINAILQEDGNGKAH